MKKILPVAAALVLALAGCSSSSKTEEAPAPEPEVIEEEVVEEEEDDQGYIIDWTDVDTAEEAASGAGFDKFGVVDKITIGDTEYKDPRFSYAGGVAQAMYEAPATAIFIRKGVGTYSVPLSDSQLDTFAARWFKVYEGTEVTCYGPAQGAVAVATWTDGVKSYGMTFMGLGGEDVTMDSDDLATIVKGINEANADKRPEEEQKAEEKKTEEKAAEDNTAKKSTLISAKDAEALVEKDSAGTCTAIDLVSTKQYGDCWYATAVDKNGTTYAYYVDNNGVHLVSKKEAEKKEEKKSTSEEHYEGEDVTIYGSVFAEWHKNTDGKWYATFTTYNGTPIYATPAPAGGGWAFYALTNGKMVQVIYSDQESSVTGEVGPGGVSSHWQGLDDKKWY